MASQRRAERPQPLLSATVDVAGSAPTGRWPDITFLSFSQFWREGAGLWARSRETLRFLAARTSVRVLMTRPLVDLPHPAQLAACGPLRFAAPDPARHRSAAAVRDWLRAQLAAEASAVYWIDKTELAPLLALCPRGARRILDTHDLQSQRWNSYRQFDVGGAEPMSEAEERALLGHFDRVICIQAEDHALVSQWLGADRTLLAPHAISAKPQAFRAQASAVGFIANRWPTNLEGLRWFLAEVWPQVFRPGLTLNLYGWLCADIAPLHAAQPVPGLVLHGHVPDLDPVYGALDVLINPVRAGAGLKIKTVEALAYGLPLVTTSEGARGLRELHGRALQIADDSQTFASALKRLLASADARQQLGTAGAAFVRQHFTPAACYAGIGQWLAAGAPPAAARRAG